MFVLDYQIFKSVGKIALFDKALVVALACVALAMCAMWVGNCLKKYYGQTKHCVGSNVDLLVLSIFLFSVLSQWFTIDFSVCRFFLHLAVTFWRLAQWRISEQKTVNTPQMLMRDGMFN